MYICIGGNMATLKDVEKKYDVVALGELLIDFTESGESTQGNSLFEANPGGAPCNLLAMLQNLGKKTAFIGKVGNDIFGKKLKQVVEEVGIDTTGLCMSEEIRTTLAFVKNDDSGERDFSFYRNPGADMMLTREEVNEEIIKSSRLFHFGTLSMTHEQVREATKHALEIAKANNLLISFDPNIREPLWSSMEEAARQVAYGLEYCDILKISDNEIIWFTGKEDYDEGIKYLNNKYNIPLIVFSMGSDGSRAYYKDMRVEVPAFIQDTTVDTTGAGDTFGGCCINYILEKGLDNLSEQDLEEMLTLANAGASIVTTRKGALRVMPSKKDIENLKNKLTNRA